MKWTVVLQNPPLRRLFSDLDFVPSFFGSSPCSTAGTNPTSKSAPTPPPNRGRGTIKGRLAADVKESMNQRGRASMEVMLDQFVFRRDGGAKCFPLNATTTAASAHTCIGVPFGVCVDLAPAPAISRFYLQWPGGPKPEAGRHCQIVAAASSSGSLLSSRARPLPRISSAPTTTSSTPTRLSSPAASRLSLAFPHGCGRRTRNYICARSRRGRK